ncbi:MAG: hypothetical protein H6622_02345 [Halobacteriovoraceae bacterium]|nr:hypothetical protein [Halobacteriovoraceae bacterium]
MNNTKYILTLFFLLQTHLFAIGTFKSLSNVSQRLKSSENFDFESLLQSVKIAKSEEATVGQKLRGKNAFSILTQAFRKNYGINKGSDLELHLIELNTTIHGQIEEANSNIFNMGLKDQRSQVIKSFFDTAQRPAQEYNLNVYSSYRKQGSIPSKRLGLLSSKFKTQRDIVKGNISKNIKELNSLFSFNLRLKEIVYDVDIYKYHELTPDKSFQSETYFRADLNKNIPRQKLIKPWIDTMAIKLTESFEPLETYFTFFNAVREYKVIYPHSISQKSLEMIRELFLLRLRMDPSSLSTPMLSKYLIEIIDDGQDSYESYLRQIFIGLSHHDNTYELVLFELLENPTKYKMPNSIISELLENSINMAFGVSKDNPEIAFNFLNKLLSKNLLEGASLELFFANIKKLAHEDPTLLDHPKIEDIFKNNIQLSTWLDKVSDF